MRENELKAGGINFKALQSNKALQNLIAIIDQLKGFEMCFLTCTVLNKGKQGFNY